MDWLFSLFYYDCSHELGAGLIFFFRLILFFVTAIFFSQIFGQVEKNDPINNDNNRIEYYRYWNPYRRVLGTRGEPHSFYGKNYYQVLYNKDDRIKSVTRFGSDREEKETFHFIWSKSGIRSEYKVEFHTKGNTNRLDSLLYANQLSYVRPGWIAQFRSRSDGRPREVVFTDALGFNYFTYHFNYTFLKDDKNFTEVIESSYFDSDGEFVGRHLLYFEKGAYLRMAQYFDSKNNINLTKEFLHDTKLEETIRIITDEKNQELERKIIPYMPPDKYAYKYEWTGKEVIDRGLKDIDNIDLALEFALRAQEALDKANEELRLAREAFDEANARAKRTQKLLGEARKKASDADAFEEEMDQAKEEAQKAIEKMFDADREAEMARLEAAAAKATLGAIEKTRDVEDFAKEELKAARKAAKLERKQARKEARAAKIALQDSLLGTDTRTFLTASYGWPVLIEQTLENHTPGVNYVFGLGRRNMFEILGRKTDVGLEVNWYDFFSDSTGQNFQTLSYYLIAQIDMQTGWSWLPSSLETNVKLGGGLVSPGYGFTIGGSAIYNLLPTPIIIGVFSQFNWVTQVINENTRTYWTTVGLSFGVNLEDKIPEILDIDFPNIFDLF
mgnify:CR=1 FL=1